MTPVELFKTWPGGGEITWKHRTGKTITHPLVLLFATADGFLAVTPGYQLEWPCPNERVHKGELTIEGGALVFPAGRITDRAVESDRRGDREVSDWYKSLEDRGITVEQERADYGYRMGYNDIITE